MNQNKIEISVAVPVNHVSEEICFSRLAKVRYSDVWKHFFLQDFSCILDTLIFGDTGLGAP